MPHTETRKYQQKEMVFIIKSNTFPYIETFLIFFEKKHVLAKVFAWVAMHLYFAPASIYVLDLLYGIFYPETKLGKANGTLQETHITWNNAQPWKNISHFQKNKF